MTELDERKSLDRMAGALRRVITGARPPAVPPGPEAGQAAGGAAPQPAPDQDQPASGDKR